MDNKKLKQKLKQDFDQEKPFDSEKYGFTVEGSANEIRALITDKSIDWMKLLKISGEDAMKIAQNLTNSDMEALKRFGNSTHIYKMECHLIEAQRAIVNFIYIAALMRLLKNKKVLDAFDL
jgi:hypothetical protein